MEKRSLIRNLTRLSVACSSLTATSSASASHGIMTNCSYDGTCIELRRKFLVGSIVIIRATCLSAMEPPGVLPEGLKTLALAEVKWSKRLGRPSASGYAIGFKYLFN